MIEQKTRITTNDILALKQTQIFIAGDLILDTYVEGKVQRISPEAPVPVVHEQHRRAVPGGAGNVAANVSAMGAVAHLCGRIGNDSEGNVLRGVLEDFGILTGALVMSTDVPTTTKMRIISGNFASSGSQQIARVDKEKICDISTAEENRVQELFLHFAEQNGHKALVLSDYGKGFLTKNLVRSLIEIANKHHIPVVTDPKSLDVSRYSGSTVIKPNLTEGRAVFRAIQPGVSFNDFESEITAISNAYLKESGCSNIVMSLSEHGVLAKGIGISTQNQTIHFDTHALQVADVSGAGDTLISFLAMGLASGLSLEQTTELGNLAAGIVCGKPGTATVEMTEFVQAFHSYSYGVNTDKLISLEDLSFLAQEIKSQQKKIVFTNGCFDILHAGHVDYLQKSKSLGDILVIGLNSDASISRLKGPTRPVQTFQDRAMVLSALGCTDFIVSFDEDTPLDLILKIKPNILVKGADYNLKTTVGAQEVISWGGTVKWIDLVPGKSTTSLIQKIKKDG